MKPERTLGSPFGRTILGDLAETTEFTPPQFDPAVPHIEPVAIADLKIIGQLATDLDIFEIRHGGMGDVYLCIDRASTRPELPVAFKSFSSRFYYDPVARRAFQRECALWVRLKYVPGICPVFNVEYFGDRPFVRMPGILPGPQGEVSLRDLIKLGPLPTDRVVFFAREIARSMSLAGKALPGLVHGDLKPENVLIIAGAPLLSDFGLARLAGQMIGGDALVSTRTYQSPQARDPAAPLAPVDDVYSFGVMLTEMLTGRSRPKHGRHNQPDRRATDATAQTKASLLALARRCRALNPAQRPADFAAVLAELDRIAPESKWPMPASAKFGTTMGVHAAGEFVMGGLSTTGLLLKLEEYDTVLELVSTTNERTRDWRMWLHQGTALALLRREPEALEAFIQAQQALDRDQDADKYEYRYHASWVIESRIAGTLMRLGGRIRVTRALHRLVKLSNNAPDVESAASCLGGTAFALIDLGKFRAAERFLKIAIENDSSNPGLWIGLGQARLSRRNCEGAAEAFGRAAQLTPSKSEYHAGLGYVLLVELARYREASDAFDRAIGCGSLHPRVFRLALSCAHLLDDVGEIRRLHRMIVRNFGAELGRTVCDDARLLADGLATAPTSRKRSKHSEHRIMELAGPD